MTASPHTRLVLAAITAHVVAIPTTPFIVTVANSRTTRLALAGCTFFAALGSAI